ncbi:MAG: hypothetical protein U5L96_14255 [Owenweeksia sp.]|nr:hypothetical protein [Owenweeksia sp.]
MLAGASCADYSNELTNINSAHLWATSFLLVAPYRGLRYVKYNTKDVYRVPKRQSLSETNAVVIFYVNRSLSSPNS